MYVHSLGLTRIAALVLIIDCRCHSFINTKKWGRIHASNPLVAAMHLFYIFSYRNHNTSQKSVSLSSGRSPFASSSKKSRLINFLKPQSFPWTNRYALWLSKKQSKHDRLATTHTTGLFTRFIFLKGLTHGFSFFSFGIQQGELEFCSHFTFWTVYK